MDIKQQFNEVKEEISIIFFLTVFVAGMQFGISYPNYAESNYFNSPLWLALLDSTYAAMMSSGGLGAVFILARLAGYEVSKIE